MHHARAHDVGREAKRWGIVVAILTCIARRSTAAGRQSIRLIAVRIERESFRTATRLAPYRHQSGMHAVQCGDEQLMCIVFAGIGQLGGLPGEIDAKEEIGRSERSLAGIRREELLAVDLLEEKLVVMW